MSDGYSALVACLFFSYPLVYLVLLGTLYRRSSAEPRQINAYAIGRWLAFYSIAVVCLIAAPMLLAPFVLRGVHFTQGQYLLLGAYALIAVLPLLCNRMKRPRWGIAAHGAFVGLVLWGLYRLAYFTA